MKIVLTSMLLLNATLADIGRFYRVGAISRADAEDYCEAWNNSCVRFTEAYVQDGEIRQREKR